MGGGLKHLPETPRFTITGKQGFEVNGVHPHQPKSAGVERGGSFPGDPQYTSPQWSPREPHVRGDNLTDAVAYINHIGAPPRVRGLELRS